MTLKLNGTNSVAAPAYAGDDADTGLQCGTNELKLVTGGSARATVDSSGNLGIGTVPSGLLTGGYNLRLNGGSQTFIAFNNSTHTTQATGGFSIGHDASAAYITQRESQPIIFSTNNTEEVRILSGGGLTFNGDTAAANALDDYEEGTWTPAIKFGGGSTGVVYSSFNRGWYTKIGRVVVLKMALEVGNKGTSTGTASIVVPFNSSLTSSSHAQMIPHSKVNANAVFAYGTAGSGEFGLKHSVASTSTGFGALNNSDFGTGFSLIGSITYMI